LKDLVQHMTDPDPEKRYSANQALEHPWFPKTGQAEEPGWVVDRVDDRVDAPTGYSVDHPPVSSSNLPLQLPPPPVGYSVDAGELPRGGKNTRRRNKRSDKTKRKRSRKRRQSSFVKSRRASRL